MVIEDFEDTFEEVVSGLSRVAATIVRLPAASRAIALEAAERSYYELARSWGYPEMRAKRWAALVMLDENLPGNRRITVAGDRGYDTREFVAGCRALRVTPHVAQNQARPGGSALDGRTVRHGGYAVSQCLRKQVEETFGWMKTVGGCGAPAIAAGRGCRCMPIWSPPPTTY